MVEDSEDDAALLAREIRRAGYDLVYKRVETEDAMRASLRTESWDAIICDYRLPTFGPLAALGVAQDGGRDLPFIVVSGTVKEETAVEALKAGAHDFIVKDRLARLVPAIARELKEAELRRERKQALDDLQLAIDARDEFLAIASQELKLPLTTVEQQIAWVLRLTRAHPLDGFSDKLTSKMESAARQVDRLKDLVSNLLAVTRITSGGLRVAPRKVNLAWIVREVVAQARRLPSGDDVEITVDASELAEGEWDPTLLETIVSNLVSNAIKFGAGNPIEVIVKVDSDLATFVVTDHGIGINVDDQGRIFRRFERVPERHFGGFGLGLWIVRQAVEAHGGQVRLSSTPGAGSTFVVELPRRQQS
jgi:signal transduction histidine kinase